MNKITFTVRRSALKDLELKGDLVENLTSFAQAINTIIRGYSMKVKESEREKFKKDLTEMVKEMIITDKEIEQELENIEKQNKKGVA